MHRSMELCSKLTHTYDNILYHMPIKIIINACLISYLHNYKFKMEI